MNRFYLIGQQIVYRLPLVSRAIARTNDRLDAHKKMKNDRKLSIQFRVEL